MQFDVLESFAFGNIFLENLFEYAVSIDLHCCLSSFWVFFFVSFRLVLGVWPWEEQWGAYMGIATDWSNSRVGHPHCLTWYGCSYPFHVSSFACRHTVQYVCTRHTLQSNFPQRCCVHERQNCLCLCSSGSSWCAISLWTWPVQFRLFYEPQTGGQGLDITIGECSFISVTLWTGGGDTLYF